MDLVVSREPILIIEDLKTSFLLSVYLEREGFNTISAHDGRHALELVGQRLPAFTILDPSLPRVDGWEVCQELRGLSDAPILILTGKGAAHEGVMWLTLGADDYVTKPISPEELVARVKAILRRTRSKLWAEPELLSHDEVTHTHEHSHDDPHHQHTHAEEGETHTHEHTHGTVTHSHPHAHDEHHQHAHDEQQ